MSGGSRSNRAKPYPDEQLVTKALDGSQLAFERLVKQYQHHVLRTISSIIRDDIAAQDVAQETFLSAWRDLAKLKDKEKFGRWLNQIAINRSKNWLRDQRKHRENNFSYDENAVVLTQELRYQHDQLRQAVWEAIDELSEEHRQVVILYYISGYSYNQISSMLSVPVSTIQGRLQKARNQLRKEFLDMVTQLQLEIDSTVHKFLKERATQDGVSIEGLIIHLIERYRMDIDNPEIAVRRVWGPQVDWCTDTSPDGRYQSYVNWSDASQGNLAIRDHTTGECRDLTDEATWMGPDRAAGWSVWSPDGKQIAYTWSHIKRPHIDHRELRIVGLDGSKPRILYDDESREVKVLVPNAWSQDGKYILAWWFLKKVIGEIVLFSVADGSVRVLKPMRFPAMPIKMDISPDGRYIVYDSPVDDYSSRDIFLLATDGSGEEVSVVEHPANDYGPVWTPDGNSIVFVSDRGGSYGIWLLQMVDGKPVGEPQLVKRDTGAMYFMRFTQDGSLYYNVDPGQQDVYVASLSPSTGELVAEATKITHTFEGFNSSPAWSPDGKYLAYQSRRWSVPRGYGTRVLVILSLETGEERVFPAKGAILERIRWSPDGRSLLCTGISREHYFALIDTQTGDVTFIVPRGDFEGRARDHEWSQDGKAIFYRRRWAGSIVRHELETGEEKELQRLKEVQLPEGNTISWSESTDLIISPDSRQLAFFTWNKDGGKGIGMIPVEGGEPREIFRLKEGEKFAGGGFGLAWSGDGILFGRSSSDGAPGEELWYVPVESGEAQKLLEVDYLTGIVAHSDGRRIAFTAGRHDIETWVMENVLQRFAADK